MWFKSHPRYQYKKHFTRSAFLLLVRWDLGYFTTLALARGGALVFALTHFVRMIVRIAHIIAKCLAFCLGKNLAKANTLCLSYCSQQLCNELFAFLRINLERASLSRSHLTAVSPTFYSSSFLHFTRSAFLLLVS